MQTDRDRGDDGVLDTQSKASSASGLHMSMLENRLENEMTKLATMMKNTAGSLQCTITSLSEQSEKKIAEVDQRLNSLNSISTSVNLTKVLNAREVIPQGILLK